MEVLNKGVHLNFAVLQWSQLVKIWGTRNETKKNPQLNACTLLADNYSSSQATTAPKLSDAPDGVCDGVGSARLQS